MATETKDPPITQEEREASADFDATQNGHAATIAAGGEPAAERPRSMEEIAQAAHDEAQAKIGEEDDGQLFVLEEGKPIGLSTLIKRGTKVEFEFKLDGKGIPGAAGMSLIGFSDPDRVMVVPGRAGKVVTSPTYDGEGQVTKVVIRQHFKPTMVYDARTDAARVALDGE